MKNPQFPSILKVGGPHLPKLSPHQLDLIAYLSASGQSATSIAKRLNVSPSAVQSHLKSPTMRALIEEERQKLYGDNFEITIKKDAPEAWATVKEIMRDESAKHGTRLTAANSILDRTHGKAIQRVEETSHSIRDLFHMLDKSNIGFAPKENSQQSEPTPQPVNVSQPQTIPQTLLTEDPSPNIDAWIEENIADEIYTSPTGNTQKVQKNREDEVRSTDHTNLQPRESEQSDSPDIKRANNSTKPKVQ